MPQTLGPQATNTTRDYGLVLSGPDNASLAGRFDGSEAFRAVLWAGDDAAPAWESDEAVAWDPDSLEALDTTDRPELVLTVPRAAVEGLGAGTYRLQVLVNPGVDDVEAFNGHLRLVAASGAAESASVYNTADDLTDEFPGLFDLQDLDTEQAAAAEPRADARAWIDDQILARAEEELAGYDRLGVWDTTRRTALETIRDLLDADKLLVDARCRRIGACYALYRALKGQVGKEGDNPYREQAMAFRAEAIRALAGWVARIDADDDGVYELTLG